MRRTGDSQPIAELRAGELIGEIGFFADLARTANVIAMPRSHEITIGVATR